MQANDVALAESDLPDVYRSADGISKEAQQEYLRWTRGRLQLVLLAAAAGVVAVSGFGGAWVEKAGGGVALAAFASALLLEMHLLRAKPEDRWYHGRALAESVKTLAWRYMAAAEPFPSTLPAEEARGVLFTRVHDLVTESSAFLRTLSVGESHVTPRMDAIRESDIDSRKNAYLTLRVRDQEAWYSAKAEANEADARKWRYLLITFEVLGVAATVVTLLDISELDVGGLIAAAIAAAGAWLEVKQYDNLASAYSLTATELAFVRMSGEGIPDEDAWSKYVVLAEQAISREHTMWLARRVGMLAVRRSFE